MILNALCSYYDRCKKDLAPEGKEFKELNYIIVISRDGNFVRLEDCMVSSDSAPGKSRKRYRSFVVPKSVPRTSRVKPNCLWDNCKYALGLTEESLEGGKGDDKNAQCHEAFVAKVDELAQLNPESDSLVALQNFLKTPPGEIEAALKADSKWLDFQKSIKTSNVSFRVDGQKSIIAEQEIRTENDADEADDAGAICLVTGVKSRPQRIIETATPIVGSQAIAKIVSFQVNSGYDSYGKSQCANAPISRSAAQKFSTALKCLLGKDSRNKTCIGSRTFVFWGAKESEEVRATEDSIWAFFGGSDGDDPDAMIHKVTDALKSVCSGQKIDMTDDSTFYFLGLAPNAARIAVVYWQEAPVSQFAKNILRHFEDMDIVSINKRGTPFVGLYSMLKAIALNDDVKKNAPPNMIEDIMKSIIMGGQYPRRLLNCCVGRIRAGAGVSTSRAAILKAYLNRLNDNQKKINKMLDKENVNAAYLCGRLFAVLESIQYGANRKTNVAERYLSSASSSPAHVFPNLLNLSIHHAEKAKWGEKAKTEIINLLPPEGFPIHLDTEDQGRFFLGYYHQKAENMKLNDDEKE